MTKALERVRIVLVQPSHPGNIGATARAMANMGLRELVLVSPKVFPSAEATARAAGADFILQQAQVVSSLTEALTDCTLVVASSARKRAVEWQNLNSDAMARLVNNHIDEAPTQRAAVVFGTEKSGLSNEDIDQCQYLVRLPVDAACTSINLATAVALLSWEVRRIRLAADGGAEGQTITATVKPRKNMPDQPRMELFFRHLEATLDEAGFFINKPSTKLMRKVRHIFMRAAPDNDELNILRGILTHFQHILRNEPSNNWPFNRAKMAEPGKPAGDNEV